MDKNNKLGVYIGRFVKFDEAEENLEFVYRVKKIQDIERTIPEYGTQRPYTEAQQVLAWTNSFEYSDPSIALTKANQIFEESSDCKYVESINYDTVFPEIISLGADVKRFDFVIKTKKKTYLIETNYYNGGGSKLNETARSYSDVAPKINQYKNYEFVWITDGQGWHSAKNKLEEAFSIIPSLYNLSTLHLFIAKIQNEGVIEI